MLRDAGFFGDQELILIYIARKLKEALALEEVLTSAGLDYLIETDTYVGGFVFRRERVGAFFYVAPETTRTAVELLARNGYEPYEPGE
ncbi:MAG: hypothetical protein HUU41_21205 [Bryobacteraceae bacterium]|nr:hypothetical protein [Bryobacterales bacterium]MEB2363542.1 hypothetical protein [Bryobacterales bacterium]NUN03635.1 hypothetical protein [Bryobacteraceae bacterium]